MKRRVNFLLVAMASVLMCQAQKPIVQTCYTSDPAPMVYKDTFMSIQVTMRMVNTKSLS